MELVTPRFDNLQNELRRELDPRGVLEEEIFQSALAAARSRRSSYGPSRYRDDRAFFAALRELRTVQAARTVDPRPIPPTATRRAKAVKPRPVTVLMFPAAPRLAA